MHKISARVRLDVAMGVAEEIVAALSAVPGCERCAYAGPLRRMRGHHRRRRHPGHGRRLRGADGEACGPAGRGRGGRARRDQGLCQDRRRPADRSAGGAPDGWGAALQYFTGSRAHNIRTREIAVHKRLKLSEYGLFDVASGDRIASADEEDVHPRLGLPWIPAPQGSTAERSRPRWRGGCPASSPPPTSAVICTPTPTSRTGWPAWRRWPPARRPGITRTTPSPTTRRTCRYCG